MVSASVFFDFDWFKEDYRLADIGYSLVISIAAWEAMIDGTMDMERVKAYLQGYHDYTKEYGILPHLPRKKRKHFLPLSLPEPFISTIGTDFFNDWENFNEYEYYYYLSHLVKTLHFIDEHQQDFYDLICSIE